MAPFTKYLTPVGGEGGGWGVKLMLKLHTFTIELLLIFILFIIFIFIVFLLNIFNFQLNGLENWIWLTIFFNHPRLHLKFS